MRFQVTKTTDRQNQGLIIDLPLVTEWGQMRLSEIQEVSENFLDGQFAPDYVHRNPPKVRLVSSNYSVELTRIQ